MKVDVRSAGDHLARLAGVALRTFAATFLALMAAGVVLAGLSYYWLRESPRPYGEIAATIALVEAAAVGVAFGAQRAVARALAEALGSLRLGRSLVRSVFERMPGVADDEPTEGRVARGLGRLPLAQAEELLGRAVVAVTGEMGSGGWLRRAIRARLLEAVCRYTLARYRAEGARHGSIDLLALKEDLEHTADDALVRKVRGGLWLWTVMVIVGLPLAVAAQTWVIIQLIHPKG